MHTLEAIKQNTKFRDLLDQVEIILRGLKLTRETIVNTFSRYVTYHVTILVSETYDDWKNSITSSRVYPKFTELETFIRTRVFATESHLDLKSTKTVKEEKKTEVMN